LPNSYAIGAGILLFLLAGPMAFFTFRSYSSKATTFLFTEPSTTIVADGPNGFIRNPGYISLIMLLSSMSFLANSIWALGMIIPAAMVINFGIVRREERYLEDIFGEAYLKYKAKVRRWL
jgi:protein-S-isoprenylcysteine O-methyltransferase Ste14